MHCKYKFYDALCMWLGQSVSGTWQENDLFWLKNVTGKYLNGNEENEIQKKYDRLRKQIPYILRPNALVLTKRIAKMGTEKISAILNEVRNFNNFNENNDPWKEHDFGSFELDGKKIFWKIDDYHGEEGYELILTIMLAEEY